MRENIDWNRIQAQIGSIGSVTLHSVLSSVSLTLLIPLLRLKLEHKALKSAIQEKASFDDSKILFFVIMFMSSTLDIPLYATCISKGSSFLYFFIFKCLFPIDYPDQCEWSDVYYYVLQTLHQIALIGYVLCLQITSNLWADVVEQRDGRLFFSKYPYTFYKKFSLLLFFLYILEWVLTWAFQFQNTKQSVSQQNKDKLWASYLNIAGGVLVFIISCTCLYSGIKLRTHVMTLNLESTNIKRIVRNLNLILALIALSYFTRAALVVTLGVIPVLFENFYFVWIFVTRWIPSIFCSFCLVYLMRRRLKDSNKDKQLSSSQNSSQSSLSSSASSPRITSISSTTSSLSGSVKPIRKSPGVGVDGMPRQPIKKGKANPAIKNRDRNNSASSSGMSGRHSTGNNNSSNSSGGSNRLNLAHLKSLKLSKDSEGSDRSGDSRDSPRDTLGINPVGRSVISLNPPSSISSISYLAAQSGYTGLQAKGSDKDWPDSDPTSKSNSKSQGANRPTENTTSFDNRYERGTLSFSNFAGNGIKMQNFNYATPKLKKNKKKNQVDKQRSLSTPDLSSSSLSPFAHSSLHASPQPGSPLPISQPCSTSNVNKIQRSKRIIEGKEKARLGLGRDTPSPSPSPSPSHWLPPLTRENILSQERERQEYENNPLLSDFVNSLPDLPDLPDFMDLDLSLPLPNLPIFFNSSNASHRLHDLPLPSPYPPRRCLSTSDALPQSQYPYPYKGQGKGIGDMFFTWMVGGTGNPGAGGGKLTEKLLHEHDPEMGGGEGKLTERLREDFETFKSHEEGCQENENIKERYDQENVEDDEGWLDEVDVDVQWEEEEECEEEDDQGHGEEEENEEEEDNSNKIIEDDGDWWRGRKSPHKGSGGLQRDDFDEDENEEDEDEDEDDIKMIFRNTFGVNDSEGHFFETSQRGMGYLGSSKRRLGPVMGMGMGVGVGGEEGQEVGLSEQRNSSLHSEDSLGSLGSGSFPLHF